MARSFASVSTQYLEAAAAVVTALPLTMACWFNPTTGDDFLGGLFNSGSSGNMFGMNMQGTTLEAQHWSSTDAAFATTTATFTTNAWHHGVVVFSAVNARSVLLNGANKVSDTTVVAAPTGLNRTSIGRRGSSIPGAVSMDGRIAEFAIWDVALTDAEVAILAARYSPLFVRPGNLVAYWPLIGRTSPEIDRVGRFELTLVNGPTAGDHPAIIYPWSLGIGVPAAAAAAVRKRRMMMGMGR